MAINQVKLQGRIASLFKEMPYFATVDPILFTVVSDDMPVQCVADQILSAQIQRRRVQGDNVFIVGHLIALGEDARMKNYVYIDKIVCENEEGYVGTLSHMQEIDNDRRV